MFTGIDLLLIIGPNSLTESILTPHLLLKIMRGRWASAAIGAGVARRRAGAEMDQQAQANQAQQQQAQQQIEAQQKQIEALQQQKQQPQQTQPQQEDPTQKLKKYADLKQQGIISEEEYQKLKADLLSKM
jgi:Tfp pilus assembly protein FimV